MVVRRWQELSRVAQRRQMRSRPRSRFSAAAAARLVVGGGCHFGLTPAAICWHRFAIDDLRSGWPGLERFAKSQPLSPFSPNGWVSVRSATGGMRAAPALGAFAMAVFQAPRSPMTRAGRTLLLSVATVGVATVVFGLSQNFWLSLAMLVCSSNSCSWARRRSLTSFR